MRVVVVGAGVAGSAAALTLGRTGHEVVLVDPEPAPPLSGSTADEVFASWQRPSVGQFQQPHNFLGRGRAVLRDLLPDLYATLVSAGAGEVDMASFLGEAPREPGDEDLATIACRRPVLDAALREAAAQQSGVSTRQADVAGLVTSGGQVTGVVTAEGEQIGADLVVDAAGRGPHTARWLEAAGLTPWREDTVDCGLLYYSRHYHFRDGAGRPPYGSLLGGPRGDLGCIAYACFLGDNDTFSLAIMAGTTDRAWRALRDAEAFERVASALPGMAPWLEAAEPVTGVLPMGSLRNTLRHVLDGDRPHVRGLVAVGDARCHTNPTFAFGATLSLWHAAVLAEAAGAAADAADVTVRLEERIGPDAQARFEAVAAEDVARLRLWSGEPLDVTNRTQSMPLFLRSVVYRVAAGDPELLRAVARRVNALDPVEALEQRTDLLDKAQALYDERSGSFPEPPPKEHLRAALSG